MTTTDTDNFSRASMVGFGLVAIALLVALMFLLMRVVRVPDDRWERASRQLDQLPIDEIPGELEFLDERESGSRFLFFFGEDSAVAREYSSTDANVDVDTICQSIVELAQTEGGNDFRSQDFSDGPIPLCSLSYRVFDTPANPSEYISIQWLVTGRNQGGFDLLLSAVRPHVL